MVPSMLSLRWRGVNAGGSLPCQWARLAATLAAAGIMSVIATFAAMPACASAAGGADITSAARELFSPRRGLLARQSNLVIRLGDKEDADWCREGEKPVACDTTKGPLHICVQPERAPLGAARFLDMVRDTGSPAFFDDVPFFRTVRGFISQTGIPGDRATLERWHKAGNIKDDPPGGHLKRGELSFAGGGKARSLTAHAIIIDVTRLQTCK